MRIFLSHASEQAAVAEAIEVALRSEGHVVFLDRSSLPSGETYNDKIRDAIAESDLFIFLISAEALAAGRYTLTELAFARDAWPRPSGRVLPVVISPVDLNSVPPYLKAVTILEPQGNVAAAVAATVARLGKPWYRRAGLTAAVLVLAVAGGGAAAWWIAHERAIAHETSALLASGRSAQESRRYQAAWDTYARAEAVAPRNVKVAAARERLAMDWLENIRVTEGGKDTFSTIVDKVTPVLETCARSQDKAHAADCQAHIGWGDFLRMRDGTTGLDLFQDYRRAVDLDPRNAYAHAMWGFTILWTHGTPETAREHFDRALASGRERPFVRHLQIAGLLSRRDPESQAAIVRVANDMRAHAEPLHDEPDDSDVWRIWDVYYDRLVNKYEVERFSSALPAADNLETFRWLFPQAKVPADKQDLYLFMLGQLQEGAGQRAAALATFRTLHEMLARTGALKWGGPVPDGTAAAIKRLSK